MYFFIGDQLIFQLPRILALGSKLKVMLLVVDLAASTEPRMPFE
jgi:hypothetical protein